MLCVCVFVFFFQAEDGIRYLVRSRGLGDVYKRQTINCEYKFVRLPAGKAALSIVKSANGQDAPATNLSLIHI